MLIKKLASVLLVSVMVLVAVPLRANAANGVVGDVNADNSISIGDIARLYAHFQGNALVGQEAMTRADLRDEGWLYPSYVQELYEQVRHFTFPDLVAAVFQLPENVVLSDTVTLKGRVVSVEASYDPTYDNMTVMMKIDGLEEVVRCYRMTGDQVDTIAVGDVITVTGQLRHWDGQVEFSAGCQATLHRGISTAEAHNKYMQELISYLPVGVSPRSGI